MHHIDTHCTDVITNNIDLIQKRDERVSDVGAILVCLWFIRNWQIQTTEERFADSAAATTNDEKKSKKKAKAKH